VSSSVFTVCTSDRVYNKLVELALVSLDKPYARHVGVGVLDVDRFGDNLRHPSAASLQRQLSALFSSVG